MVLEHRVASRCSNGRTEKQFQSIQQIATVIVIKDPIHDVGRQCSHVACSLDAAFPFQLALCLDSESYRVLVDRKPSNQCTTRLLFPIVFT